MCETPLHQLWNYPHTTCLFSQVTHCLCWWFLAHSFRTCFATYLHAANIGFYGLLRLIISNKQIYQLPIHVMYPSFVFVSFLCIFQISQIHKALFDGESGYLCPIIFVFPTIINPSRKTMHVHLVSYWLDVVQYPRWARSPNFISPTKMPT